MRLLIDTNVFLDYLLNREDANDIELLFSNCAKRKNQIYITSQSLRDIEYSAHKHFHDHNLSKYVQMSAYKICYKVIGISADAAIESLYSDVDDYEDSLQVEAAKEALLDCIVTSNKKDFKNCGIAVFTPAELNDIWSKQ